VLTKVRMLDIKFIRQNPEKVKEACQKRQADVDVDKLLELDKKRREGISQTDSLAAEENRISSLVSREPDSNKREELIQKGKEIKRKLKSYQDYLKDIEKEFKDLLSQIPNLPLEDVPVGEDDTANVVLREEGKSPISAFSPKNI